MKIRLAKSSRFPHLPWWAVVVIVVWLAAVGGTEIAQHRAGLSISLCVFKRLTGLPCPTCGSTRAAESLLAGHPLQAWLFNPLVCTIIAVAGVLLAVRLIAARAVRLDMSQRESNVVTVVAIVLVLVNWAYVIIQGY